MSSPVSGRAGVLGDPDSASDPPIGDSGVLASCSGVIPAVWWWRSGLFHAYLGFFISLPVSSVPFN